VACVAARELALRGQELLAISSVVNRGSHPVPESDERHFVQSVVDQEPNIKIEWALGTQFLPINFDEKYLDRFDEPPNDSFFFRTRELYQIASSRNARILLLGSGGDRAASYDGSGWLEQLARKGRLLELTRQLSAQARIRGVNTKSILKTEVLRPLSPQWLRNLHDRRRLGGPRPLSWDTVINPDFAARMRLDVLWNELGLATDRPQDMRLFYKKYLNWGHTSADSARVCVPTPQPAHPLLDRRIWEFCYRVPLEQFVLDGMPRSLFRRAMSEVLPAPIRNRTSKWYPEDFSVRMVDQKKQVSDFLKHYGNNLVWQYVHRPPIEKWLRRTETGWTDGQWDSDTLGVLNAVKMVHFLLWLTGA
jgi:asparagine synthase (glutamine-hydrolysing)